MSVSYFALDREIVDSAISDMGDVVELTIVSRDDVYKAVYSAKITTYQNQR